MGHQLLTVLLSPWTLTNPLLCISTSSGLPPSPLAWTWKSLLTSFPVPNLCSPIQGYLSGAEFAIYLLKTPVWPVAHSSGSLAWHLEPSKAEFHLPSELRTYYSPCCTINFSQAALYCALREPYRLMLQEPLVGYSAIWVPFYWERTEVE